MINKILNEYIRLYNIKDAHILKQVLKNDNAKAH
jgi:hypothetical protein